MAKAKRKVIRKKAAKVAAKKAPVKKQPPLAFLGIGRKLREENAQLKDQLNNLITAAAPFLAVAQEIPASFPDGSSLAHQYQLTNPDLSNRTFELGFHAPKMKAGPTVGAYRALQAAAEAAV